MPFSTWLLFLSTRAQFKHHTDLSRSFPNPLSWFIFSLIHTPCHTPIMETWNFTVFSGGHGICFATHTPWRVLRGDFFKRYVFWFTTLMRVWFLHTRHFHNQSWQCLQRCKHPLLSTWADMAVWWAWLFFFHSPFAPEKLKLYCMLVLASGKWLCSSLIFLLGFLFRRTGCISLIQTHLLSFLYALFALLPCIFLSQDTSIQFCPATCTPFGKTLPPWQATTYHWRNPNLFCLLQLEIPTITFSVPLGGWSGACIYCTCSTSTLEAEEKILGLAAFHYSLALLCYILRTPKLPHALAGWPSRK